MGTLKHEAGMAGRFAVVGIINTIFGCGLMFALYNLAGCSYWLSSAANYFFGGILSYILNRKFTFRYSGSTVSSFVRFAITVMVCYLCAYGISRPAITVLLGGICGLNVKTCENLAMVAGMILYTLFNYLGQRFFAFRKKENG